MQIKNISHKLAAVATMGALLASSDAAWATGNTFSAVTNRIVTSTSTIPQMTSLVAYIAGGALGVTGLFKLKQHVDNPGQVAMKDALIRLGVGGALLALPAVMRIMIDSTTGDTLNVSPKVFGNFTP